MKTYKETIEFVAQRVLDDLMNGAENAYANVDTYLLSKIYRVPLEVVALDVTGEVDTLWEKSKEKYR